MRTPPHNRPVAPWPATRRTVPALPFAVALTGRISAALLALATVATVTGCAAAPQVTAGTGLSGTAAPGPSRPAAPAWTDCSGGYVALTYDDGPNDRTTARLLDELAAHGMRATFFNTGAHTLEHPDLSRRELAEGHDIQNHTWDHADLATLPMAKVVEQLAQTTDAITAVGAPRPAFYRPPYNSTTPAIQDAAARTGLTEVGFTVNTFDYRDPSAEEVVAAALTAGPRGIVQMHDSGHENSVAAVAGIAAGLRERHMCPGRLARTSQPHPDSPDYQRFYAAAVVWP